jgi:predicted  nucleic acid-binding Zn-ribbon protein
MYGGSVVDPREIASLERELAHLGGRRDELEETLLTVMERVEGLQASLTESSREANDLRERWDVDRPELVRREEALVDTIAGMRAERDALAAHIEPRALSLYTRLRASTGQAVATIRSGVCGICRVTLPPKDVQHARAGTLVPCPNCGRILASAER